MVRVVQRFNLGLLQTRTQVSALLEGGLINCQVFEDLKNANLSF